MTSSLRALRPYCETFCRGEYIGGAGAEEVASTRVAYAIVPWTTPGSTSACSRSAAACAKRSIMRLRVAAGTREGLRFSLAEGLPASLAQPFVPDR